MHLLLPAVVAQPPGGMAEEFKITRVMCLCAFHARTNDTARAGKVVALLPRQQPQHNKGTRGWERHALVWLPLTRKCCYATKNCVM
jgi:hypothetical protein